MRLFLARHGNTFAPGDPVVMAGLTNDLPLVKRGEEQAVEVAEFMRSLGAPLAAVYASELRRTQQGGEILIERKRLKTPLLVDARLNELDYGAWTGLTDNEIDTRFGTQPRQDWQKKSQWPQHANWGESEADVEARVADFASMLLTTYPSGANVFATTHGGLLRYFLKLVNGEWEKRHAEGTVKVKTGHVCCLSYKEGAWSLDFWNKNPVA